MVKSACGIEAVYMCFNGTGIWGGETIRLRFDDLLNNTTLYTRITIELATLVRFAHSLRSLLLVRSGR